MNGKKPNNLVLTRLLGFLIYIFGHWLLSIIDVEGSDVCNSFKVKMKQIAR